MNKQIHFYLSKNLFPLEEDKRFIPFDNFIFKYSENPVELENEINAGLVDLIVLDGSEKGIQYCIDIVKQISPFTDLKKIPVFAVVQNADKDEIKQGYSNGIEKIYTQPIEKMRLYKNIRDYFESSQVVPVNPKALVIDDNDSQREIIVKILKHLGVDSLTATNGKEAVDNYLYQTDLSIIISDIFMPVMDGFETCNTFKSRESFKHVPFIALTSQGDIKNLKKILELGANDFITKPVNIDEFIARVKAHLRLKEYYDEIQKHIAEEEKLNMMLMDLSSRLNIMAVTDYLTGIYNRRYIMEYIKTELEKCNRYKNCFSIIMFDIDHFKKINDTYGHQAGDKILIEVCEAVKNTIRKSDVFGRIGGEEFLCICNSTNLEGAGIMGEKLRKAVESLETVYEEQSIHVTISLGVAEALPDLGLDKLLQKTDDALYLAKKYGRNRMEYALS